ncbi:MAG: ATP-binding protein [Planctomycetota bacterium]
MARKREKVSATDSVTVKDGAKVEIVNEELEAQRAYARKLLADKFDFSIVVGKAFVRGMRDIGYKSTGTAIDELIDNAVQASAQNVHVVFGYDGEGDSNKPNAVAVIDDGHGMEPVMLRAAVLWGGTHRENDRSGFGRYGYGLPSASVSQGERFTVYSKVGGGEYHKVTMDVAEIGDGLYTNSEGRICVPEPVVGKLPDWIEEYINDDFDGGRLANGTVIVLERLDRLTWKTRTALRRNLLEHFGTVYRNYLRQFNLVVDGEKVAPLDPLFITPGCRFYDLDEDRAEALGPLAIDVKEQESRKVIGTMKVRFSYMPPTFQVDKTGEKKNNARLHIMRLHHGIIVMRSGRQIDVVAPKAWTTLTTYDRNWGVEVDFPPTLDEEFHITTSKQQVVLSDRMWELLRQAGVYKAIGQMRKRFKEDKARVDVRAETGEAKRPSEAIMEEIQKFKTSTPAEPSTEQKREAQEAVEREVQERSRKSGVPAEKVRPQLLQEIQGFPYKLEEKSQPYGPFFYVERRGGQGVVCMNTAHRFYTDVYAGPESTPRLRAALELLLFVIGDCELGAGEDRRLFYESERNEWSKQLNIALDRLNQRNNIDDQSSADAAESEEEVAAAEAELE